MNSSPSDAGRPSGSNIVLDASALLALVFNELGAARVAAALSDGALMSTVNLSEVTARLVDDGLAQSEIDSTLEPLGIEYVEFSTTRALRAGLLRRETRRLGLSLGDRACLALALEVGLPALTSDRSWANLDLDVRVELCR